MSSNFQVLYPTENGENTEQPVTSYIATFFNNSDFTRYKSSGFYRSYRSKEPKFLKDHEDDSISEKGNCRIQFYLKKPHTVGEIQKSFQGFNLAKLEFETSLSTKHNEVSNQPKRRTGIPHGKIGMLISIILVQLCVLWQCFYSDSNMGMLPQSFSHLSFSSYPDDPFQDVPDNTEENLPDGSNEIPNKPVNEKPYNFTKAIPNPLPHDKIINPVTDPSSYIKTLEVFYVVYDENHLNIIIRDAEKKRWELPLEEPYVYPKNPKYLHPDNSNFDIQVTDSPFNITVKRKKTNEILFQLVDRFVFTDLYIEYSFSVPTNNLYGFGERLAPLQYKPGTYTLFEMDRSGLPDPGRPGFNSHGHQPLYLNKEKSGLYHISFLRNTNAQEVIIKPNNQITWKLIGGVIDLNFFLGGEGPEEVIERYHDYIGGWALPALWHLGYHQCKWWGYLNYTQFEFVLKEYDRVKLPLDGMWSDIDYLKEAANFLINEELFPPEKMNALMKKYKKRWIPVIQSYLPVKQKECHVWTYPNVTDLAIKDGQDPTRPLLGWEFSGELNFIDYLHPKAEDFWDYMMTYLNNKIELSGAWLDANEMTNFGIFHQSERHPRVEHGKYYRLPFYPGGKHFDELAIVDLNAIHYGGIEDYNIRSLTSLLQCKATYKHLKKRFPFPFILTRANMFGGGRFAYHFIPDSFSSWESIWSSIGTIMSFGIFGFPMIGADVCGMAGQPKTPPELCARWYQLSVFYPFARNHHSPNNGKDNNQEPYRYDGVYFETISSAIFLRYSYLKQFYTTFFRKRRGEVGYGVILKPFFFEFATDSTLPPFGHWAHEREFMFGDSILIAPVFFERVDKIEIYLPNCRWFDLRTNEEMQELGKISIIHAQLTEPIPHFLRGGKIIFKQNSQGIMSSEDLDNNFELIAGFENFIENEETKTSSAVGYIMSPTNYSEEYIFEHCIMDECILKVSFNYVFKKQNKASAVFMKIKDTRSPKVKVNESIKAVKISLLGIPNEVSNSAEDFVCVNCDTNEITLTKKGEGWVQFTVPRISLESGKQYTFHHRA